MQDQAHISLPTTGKPVRTVQKINNALRRKESVFAELSDGRVEQICWSRHKGADFQVQLEQGKRWESAPRRVWVEKSPSGVAEQTARPRVTIQRTPVASSTLEEVQARFFQAPLWLESAAGDWVIMPQIGRRRLVLKRWREESGILHAASLTELVALMQAHQGASHLLGEDEQAPLSSWLIAQAVVEEMPALPANE
jgi:hypothetical protein